MGGVGWAELPACAHEAPHPDVAPGLPALPAWWHEVPHPGTDAVGETDVFAAEVDPAECPHAATRTRHRPAIARKIFLANVTPSASRQNVAGRLGS